MSFGFAMIVFGVRIQGSVIGFLAVCGRLRADGVDLRPAGRGARQHAGRRAASPTLAVLMMVMLGGAWVPTFIFPAWLQQFTLVVPARWAVDGLDAMTWRGLAAAPPSSRRWCCSASRFCSGRWRSRGSAGRKPEIIGG